VAFNIPLFASVVKKKCVSIGYYNYFPKIYGYIKKMVYICYGIVGNIFDFSIKKGLELQALVTDGFYDY